MDNFQVTIFIDRFFIAADRFAQTSTRARRNS